MRIICVLEDIPGECDKCKKGKGCPDDWPNDASKVDQILALLDSNRWVQLDENQELPDYYKANHRGRQYDALVPKNLKKQLINSGWVKKKVKEF